MITLNQAKQNFANCIKAVKEAKTSKELGRIGYQLYSKFNDADTKKFYFPEGKMDEFWSEYKKKKQHLAEQEAAHAGEQKEMNLTSTDSQVA